MIEVEQPGAIEPRAEMNPMDVWTESRPRIGHTKISTGKVVYFLSMDGADHHKLIAHNTMHPDSPMPDAQIVAMCACDQTGRKLFTEVTHGVGFLQGRDSCDLRKVAVAILRHSHVPTTKEEAEAQEKKS